MYLHDYHTPSEPLPSFQEKPYVRRSRYGGHTPIWVIHGCAGMGKTVFLSQLATEWPAPAVFLHLQEADNDPTWLCAHLYHALRYHTGEDPLGQSEVSPSHVHAYILRTLSEHRYTLLVDGGDILRDSTAMAHMESLLAPAALGQYRVAVAARTVPRFALRYMLGDSCTEIGPAQLAFTPEETEENIRLQLPRDAAVLAQPLLAAQLNEFAGGWPAAEVMLLREITSGRDRELNLVSAAERSRLREYIEYHVLRELSPELATYIHHTAFLPKCDEAVCRGVLGERNPKEKLARLLADGILVRPDCGSDAPVYPPVIRQVLTGLLSPKKRQELEEKAVYFYVKNGRMADAIAMLFECDDADMVENLLARFGGQLLENREFALIGYCAEILDRYRMPSDAAVLGILGQYYYYCGQYADMERVLNMADSMFGRENLYSVYRGLYNGLIKWEKNPSLHTEVVLHAVQYLKEQSIPLPFLHTKEAERLHILCHSPSASADTPFRMHRFGSFALVRRESNTAIPFRTKKAGEFLAYMVERNGKPIQRDPLISVLWREHMPESAVAMLHNIIYSLRRELSRSDTTELISYKAKSYALNMSLIADEDEAIFAACRAVREKDTEQLKLYAHLFTTYWGGYLANLDCPWANELREHYDRLFVEGCLALASLYHSESEWEKELLLLKNAFTIDPYSEQILREILYCHTAQGYPNRAKQQYDKYCAFIGEELGIEPSKWLKKEFLACFSENRQ